MKLTKVIRGKGQSDPQENGGNVTLIHPMCQKPQIFTDQVLQCVFDKYIITYRNIWGKDVVRPHLVGSSYCKTLRLLNGVPILHHFLRKKRL